MYLNGDDAVDMYGDREGRATLVQEIQYILDHPTWDHEHVVTETGGGYGLGLSTIPRPERWTIHRLDILLTDEAGLPLAVDVRPSVD